MPQDVQLIIGNVCGPRRMLGDHPQFMHERTSFRGGGEVVRFTKKAGHLYFGAVYCAEIFVREEGGKKSKFPTDIYCE